MSVTARHKLDAVKRVLDRKEPIGEVAKDLNISRQSLYKWIKEYEESPNKSSTNLENNYSRGKSHYKSLSWKIEKQVLDISVKHPDYSLGKITLIANESEAKVSEHGVYNVLARNNLQTKELRRDFSARHLVKTVIASEMPALSRSKIVEQHLNEGKSIASICREWGVSRPTFYQWLKRYKSTISEEGTSKSKLFEALSRKYKRGYAHHRAVSEAEKDKVLELVKRNPELSVHKIYSLIKEGGVISAGHHAIQNILKRENLNKFSLRKLFSGIFSPRAKVAVAPLYIPTIPKYSWKMLLSPYKKLPKMVRRGPKVAVPYMILLTSPFVSVAWFLKIIATTPGQSPVGLFFSSVALSFGLFFFIYSLKYYITILFVLKLAQNGARPSEG